MSPQGGRTERAIPARTKGLTAGQPPPENRRDKKYMKRSRQSCKHLRLTTFAAGGAARWLAAGATAAGTVAQLNFVHDLASGQPERVQRLSARWQTWADRVGSRPAPPKTQRLREPLRAPRRQSQPMP